MNSVINQRSEKQWSPYLAVATAEGFCEGEGATAEEQLEAWAYLIATGQVWSLQGWFGRSASELIRSGYVDREGQIDWDAFDSKFNG